MKRGTIKRFREYLNTKYANNDNWRHGEFQQRTRGYGDLAHIDAEARAVLSKEAQ